MLNEHEEWVGTAAELGELACRLLREVNHDAQDLTERLVRYYVQCNVLDRPMRAGRESMFGYRQLLQLLVARVMAADGWPLAKIAAFNQQASEKELLDMAPQPRAADRAAPKAGPATPAAQPVKVDKLIAATATTTFVPTAVAGVPTRQWLELTLSNHCRVLLDQQFIKSLNPEIAETLAHAFSEALARISTRQNV